MKKVIKLSESDLTNIIKKVIYEQKNQFTPQQIPSDYLGKGGSFENKLYGGLTAEKYYETLNRKKPEEIKKVRLIFPQSKWEEIALNLIKKLGIVTGFFSNLDTAINFVKNLSKKGVKSDEFVIGSHGSKGMLLQTIEHGGYFFNNDFLQNFKSIIHPGTKVFFTACNGADFLDSLKDASEKLGVGAYGSSGIYNFITNTSEKGYYWCSPKKFNTPTSKKIKPWFYDNRTINLNILTEKSKYDNTGVEITVKIKDGVFDRPILPVKFKQNESQITEFNISPSREALFFLRYLIDLRYAIANQFTLPEYLRKQKETEINNTYIRKENELNKKGKLIDDYIKEKVMSNEIIVEILYNGENKNIKLLPYISKPTDITNEYLLKTGLCKKVDNPPISWISDIM